MGWKNIIQKLNKKYEKPPEKAPHKNENFSLVLLSNKKKGRRAM